MSSKIIQNKNIIEVCSRGQQGASAYAVAVNNGYLGTETEWLASLKGEKGDALTWSDLTSEQISQLVGPQGATGATGATGKAFTMIKCETVADMSNISASNGDYVVITDGDNKGNLYQKVTNSWELITNILGPIGNTGDKGEKGDSGTSIVTIDQTGESTLDNGLNIIKITLSNGTTKNVFVRNGSSGANGADGYTIVPYIEGTVLKWSVPEGANVVAPIDMDLQALANLATSSATAGLETEPVDIFENDLEEDTLLS